MSTARARARFGRAQQQPPARSDTCARTRAASARGSNRRHGPLCMYIACPARVRACPVRTVATSVARQRACAGASRRCARQR
eukprot:5650794-Pleurochrysis_carterae.AAC.1